jgi:hypothetical protein
MNIIRNTVIYRQFSEALSGFKKKYFPEQDRIQGLRARIGFTCGQEVNLYTKGHIDLTFLRSNTRNIPETTKKIVRLSRELLIRKLAETRIRTKDLIKGEYKKLLNDLTNATFRFTYLSDYTKHEIANDLNESQRQLLEEYELARTILTEKKATFLSNPSQAIYDGFHNIAQNTVGRAASIKFFSSFNDAKVLSIEDINKFITDLKTNPEMNSSRITEVNAWLLILDLYRNSNTLSIESARNNFLESENAALNEQGMYLKKLTESSIEINEARA